MSRNVLYALIGIVLVILVLVLVSNRQTAPQSGFVSPTPAEENMTVTQSPAMEVSPTTEAEVTLSPTTSPTVPVTISPTTTAQ